MFSLIALMAVVTVQAQSICGTWQMMKPDVKESENGKVITSVEYTFNEDGTFVSNADVTLSDTKSDKFKEMDIKFKGSIIGVYTLEKNKLSLFYNGTSLKVDVVSITVDGEVMDDPYFLPMIQDKIATEGKAKIAQELTDDHYTIKFSANGSMLELTDMKDGKTDRMMRISKKN